MVEYRVWCEAAVGMYDESVMASSAEDAREKIRQRLKARLGCDKVYCLWTRTAS